MSKTDAVLPQIKAAKYFEPAARLLLEHLLVLANRAVVAGPVQWRVLRATLHWRPGGNYQNLVTVEFDDRAPAVDPWTSASVWKSVFDKNAAVLMTVHDAAIALLQGEPDYRAQVSQGSRLKLQRGDTTHLMAAPLRTRKGGVLGMVTLDINADDEDAALNLGELAIAIQKCLDSATGVLGRLPHEPIEDPALTVARRFVPVIGEHTRGVLQAAALFASSRRPVLITGPSGSGKTFLARALHAQAKRTGEFRNFDCKAYGPDIQMLELVGAVKNAPLNIPPKEDIPGLVKIVSDGTLFVDDVDALKLEAQANLLAMLDPPFEYTPLGSKVAHKLVNVRWVFATNAETTGSPLFRQDLLNRIGVLKLHMPGLNERRDELPGWTEYFLAKHQEDYGDAGSVSIQPDAVQLIQVQDWSQGNLRQLDAVLYRAYLFARGLDGASSVDVTRTHVLKALERSAEHRAAGASDALVRCASLLAGAILERGDSAGAELGAYLATTNSLAAHVARAIENMLQSQGLSAKQSHARSAELMGRGDGNLSYFRTHDARRIGDLEKKLKVPPHP